MRKTTKSRTNTHVDPSTRHLSSFIQHLQGLQGRCFWRGDKHRYEDLEENRSRHKEQKVQMIGLSLACVKTRLKVSVVVAQKISRKVVGDAIGKIGWA